MSERSSCQLEQLHMSFIVLEYIREYKACSSSSGSYKSSVSFKFNKKIELVQLILSVINCKLSYDSYTTKSRRSSNLMTPAKFLS